MQAVVLDGTRLTQKPPASLSPPPRAPRACAICSQLAAGCQRLGGAGGSWHCHPWLWLQLLAIDVPGEGTRSSSSSLCSSQISGEPWVVPTELPGLSWRTGQGGSGSCGFSSPIQAPDWSWLFSRDGHVPPCAWHSWEGPGMDRMGSPISGCPRGTIKGTLGLFRSYPIQTSAHSLSSVLLHFQDSSPPVFHQFSCPYSIPSSCVGTLRVNFSSSIPIPSPMRSFSSAP